MARGREVLEMLLPNGGWAIAGDDYEGIQFINCEPITKKQFTDGFAKFDAYQAKKDADDAAAKSALLDRIGLTADELKLILG